MSPNEWVSLLAQFLLKKNMVHILVMSSPWERIHVGMDEMYDIAQQAKYRFLGVDEMYKICDG